MRTYVKHINSSISSKQQIRRSDASSQQRKVRHRSKAARHSSSSKTVPAACMQQ